MEPFTFCPTCGDEFGPYPLMDIYLKGYSCANGHYFYSEIKKVLAVDSAKAQSFPSPKFNGENDGEIIEYWLTNEEARSKLNTQIAVIIRRIHEITKQKKHISKQVNAFTRCTICNNELIKYEQPDIWVVGKKCSQSHEVAERGNAIHFFHSGELVELSAEMSDDLVLWLSKQWLKDKSNKHMKTQLNKEIIGLLDKYKLD